MITLSICIKDMEEAQVSQALKNTTISPFIEILKSKFKVKITINDLKAEFIQINKFLSLNNLKDENPFFNEFNIDPFGLIIDFSLLKEDEIKSTIFISRIAEAISSRFETECLLMQDDMRKPVVLYKKGNIVQYW